MTTNDLHRDASAVTAETPTVPYRDLPRGVRAAVEALRFTWFAIIEWVGFAWSAVVFCLCFVGVGVLLVPATLDLYHVNAERQRRWAYLASGVPVFAAYPPADPEASPFDVRSTWRRLQQSVVRRDLTWNLLNPIVGLVLSVLPAGLLLHGLRGIVEGAVTLITGRAGLIGGWYGLFRDDPGQWSVLVLLGAIDVVIGYLIARPLLRAHGEWARLVLGADVPGELQARLDRVRETRRSALDLQEAEIARIERDLHDGAQSRLVAMGMTLSQVVDLVREDPERAIAVIERAKDHSAAALDELRGLVRGIRPPVLADRGLADALRALAASSPVPTEVDAALEGRLAASLESALYFAGAELHTNAVKHANASRIDIGLHEADGAVTLRVRDDGVGGAEVSVAAGVVGSGGIDGIRRRLEPFDGTLEVSSPVGGPTTATVVAPAVRA